MSRRLQKLQRFFREVKRRNVYKVAVAYVAVAFVGLPAVDLLIPATTLPSWADAFLLATLIIGFPIALVVAWAFEMTPEGVRRTAEAEPEAPEPPGAGTRMAYKVLVGVGLMAAAVAGGWYLTGGGGPTVSDRSVAVLPFEAQGQEEPGTFTAGMHAALSSRLGNVSDLKVNSSRAVQAFEDTALSTAEIAGELGVTWMVSGNVQTTEDEVQVIVELVDPTTGTQRWSDEFTRELTTERLFDLQGEIARRIAQSLEAQLTPEETQRVESRPTNDLDAYRLYVQGRRRLYRREASPMREAVDYFRSAIEQDSTYALAWAGLADAVSLQHYGYEVPESVPTAEEAARRALDLEPDLAEAHASLGHVYFFDQQRRHVPALRELRRAVELKPSYAQAHHWLGVVYLRLGRPEKSREHLSLAVELNPGAWNFHDWLGTAYVATGEIEKALEEARQSRRLHTGTNPPWTEVRAHGERGDFEEIRRIAREYRSAMGDPGGAWIAYLGMAEAELGDTARAGGRLRQLERGGEPGWAGLVHAALGDGDAAFQAFQEAKWPEGPDLALRYFYPLTFGSLRDDPRYEGLIRDINESMGLNPDGSLPDSVDVSFGSEVDD